MHNIDINKFSKRYNVRNLNHNDVEMIYSFCKSNTQYYEYCGKELSIEVEYNVKEHVQSLPRFGLEFAVSKTYDKFSYVGFGPLESYVDKNVASEYGYYESDAHGNYEQNYIRPQESGSHYASTYLEIKDLFALTAMHPFSFSVNPYTTKQLWEITHNFELPKNDFVNICVDLGMRGVGSYACGPALEERYEIPKKGVNIFKYIF